MKIRATMLVLGIGLVVAITVAGYGLNHALSGIQARSAPLPRLEVSR